MFSKNTTLNAFLTLAIGLMFSFFIVDIRQGFKRTATVAFKKADGSDGTVDGVPVWESSDPSAISITPSEDGLSCELIALENGTSDITVTGDGDLGEGIVAVAAMETFVSLAPLGAESAAFAVSEQAPV